MEELSQASVQVDKFLSHANRLNVALNCLFDKINQVEDTFRNVLELPNPKEEAHIVPLKDDRCAFLELISTTEAKIIEGTKRLTNICCRSVV